MSNVVELVLFKLKEGVSEQQFLAAADELNTGFLSLQKGCLDRKLARNGDSWVDIVLWETMDDAISALKASDQNSAARPFLECIDETSCSMQHLTIARTYNQEV